MIYLPNSAKSLIYPKIPKLLIHANKFEVSLATNLKEKSELFQLRHNVFCKEFKKRKNITGHEVDWYDSFAKYLIIKDKPQKKIVGTYRLISTRMNENFYSASEFEASDFFKHTAKKVELSRACIDPEYRNGAVLTLLWKGLHHYLTQHKIRFLFGCSSVQTDRIETVASIMKTLIQKDAIETRWQITPKKKYLAKNNELIQKCFEAAQCDDRILPPLMRGYLKAGAKFAILPAYDAQFGCFDFFTILDSENLNSKLDDRLQTPTH